jgi:hypothetical protein
VSGRRSSPSRGTWWSCSSAAGATAPRATSSPSSPKPTTAPTASTGFGVSPGSAADSASRASATRGSPPGPHCPGDRNPFTPWRWASRRGIRTRASTSVAHCSSSGRFTSQDSSPATQATKTSAARCACAQSSRQTVSPCDACRGTASGSNTRSPTPTGRSERRRSPARRPRRCSSRASTTLRWRVSSRTTRTSPTHGRAPSS